MSTIKIGTWNLCLGLGSKKELVQRYIQENNLDVCCVQETEIDKNFNEELLTFPGYSLEVEKNGIKRRVAIYVRNTLNYRRRVELEGTNRHLVIVDVLGRTELRIITIYRTFKPQDNITARENFELQLNLIKESCTKECIILGDFNIDHAMKYDITYANKHLFADFENSLSHLGLFQHVNFSTWSRMVNGVLRESVLDHVYSKNPTSLSNLKAIRPVFGDHMLITFDYAITQDSPNEIWKRDWRLYSKTKLCDVLRTFDWSIDVLDVQQFWNLFEQKLLNVIDTIVPYTKFCHGEIASNRIGTKMKTLQNARKNHLKKFKIRPTDILKQKIKQIDFQIKKHFYQEKCKKIRRGILPGNSKSLWTAVRLAKNQNIESFPKNIYENGIKIPDNNVPDRVAEFFDNKVKRLVRDSEIEPSIYNGRPKILANECFFMGREAILDCVSSLKIKNSEGYDRIPQRIIKDGIELLIAPLTFLFKLIYDTKTIPDQWRIAKVNPIPKKGQKNEISNYRPISNLSSISKVFEKLILKRIIDLQNSNNVDLTGDQQHGFKKNKSTATAGLLLQSIIAKHVDKNELVAMASLDLSAAFDLVNTKLLIKRLKILGLPMDVVDLVKIWLEDRSFYVSVDGKNSKLMDLVCGTVQGSILGPILYAMFVSPLFDLHDLTNFADDNFIIRWSSCRAGLRTDIERTLESISVWLKGSGLAVNESKTELCLFHRLDQPSMSITLSDSQIKSKCTMNILGVTFDSKLQWSAQVSNAIIKANRSLCAIKLIKKYFRKDELRTLLTSNFYSILYYNSEIWHIPSLNQNSKHLLLSASARALKLCNKNYSNDHSYIALHKLNKRATPNQFLIYKHALILFKLYNCINTTTDWINLNFQQILTSRQTNFIISRDNNYKIGSNLICNRLTVLNTLIPLEWLTLSFGSFKLKCKDKFL